MANNEKFCLRWNDFESNISVAFREIREEKDFFDCTLSCGSRQIQAHKLILSACSPFFRSVLRQNPHQHPLLYLKGVEFSDLQAVLNFMYHGEVNVAQEELNSFLAVAEELKVKGLTQSSSGNDSSNTKPKAETPTTSNVARARIQRDKEENSFKRSRPPPSTDFHDDDIQEVQPVIKQEPTTVVAEPLPPSNQPPVPIHQTYSTADPSSIQTHTVAQVDESYGTDGYDYGEYGDDEMYDGTLMDNNAAVDNNKGYIDLDSMVSEIGKGNFSCTQCGKSSNSRKDLKRHITSKHIVCPPVRCPFCMKEYKNQPCLQAHISQSHRNEHSSQKESFLQY